MARMPRPTASSLKSAMTTCMFAAAATCAMPDPIWPAPTTPTTLTLAISLEFVTKILLQRAFTLVSPTALWLLLLTLVLFRDHRQYLGLLKKQLLYDQSLTQFCKSSCVKHEAASSRVQPFQEEKRSFITPYVPEPTVGGYIRTSAQSMPKGNNQETQLTQLAHISN